MLHLPPWKLHSVRDTEANNAFEERQVSCYCVGRKNGILYETSKYVQPWNMHMLKTVLMSK
jgi:hypothetical protein